MSDKKYIIAPSILASDFAKLGEEVRDVLTQGPSIGFHPDSPDSWSFEREISNFCSAFSNSCLRCHKSEFFLKPRIVKFESIS